MLEELTQEMIDEEIRAITAQFRKNIKQKDEK